MVKISRLIWPLLLVAGFWPWLASAAEVKAVPDRDQLSLDESLHLELRVDGSADGDPDLSPLDKDWEVVSRSQSSQIQIINGSFSRSLVYSLTLMPRHEGDLTIPGICFGADCSEPLSIRVSDSGQSSAGTDTSEVLLEAEATPYQVYTQQQLLFKVRLLHRIDLMQGSLSEPQPSGVDAVVQKLGDDRKYETRSGGRLYQVIERTYAIFPQAAGTLQIPPLRFDGQVGRGISPFDPFGGRGELIRKRTQTIPIKVLPPPTELGGRVWLPAKALTLNDDWQGPTRQLTVGEPATRTLTLSAEGLQGAQLPELRFDVPADFKSYPDQPSRKDDVGTTGITGTLQQKIALVPTRPGHYQLPAVDLDWWDVGARQWRKAHLDPVTIDVSPATGGSTVTPPSTLPPVPEAGPATTAPAPEPSTPAVAPPSEPVPAVVNPGFWPWLSLALGLGWLATLVVMLWQKVKRGQGSTETSDESPLLREKNARQAVKQAARANDPGAARQALAAWCKTLWPEAGAAGLERLAQADPLFKEELARLNRVLYSSNQESWEGQGLLDAVRQWDRQHGERSSRAQLPGLYPPSGRKDRGNFGNE